VSAIAATAGVVANIDSIAGLNGSGVHDQLAIPPPTRANMKAKVTNATNKTHKQTKENKHNHCDIILR
jgi:hypothetical protein